VLPEPLQDAAVIFGVITSAVAFWDWCRKHEPYTPVAPQFFLPTKQKKATRRDTSQKKQQNQLTTIAAAYSTFQGPYKKTVCCGSFDSEIDVLGVAA
jgi:hypothetical protein